MLQLVLKEDGEGQGQSAFNLRIPRKTRNPSEESEWMTNGLAFIGDEFS
ncbi:MULTISPECIES: hypothetical protein [Sutterella]|nr:MULTISPECIES: hypothetical protein [Sutterella]